MLGQINKTAATRSLAANTFIDLFAGCGGLSLGLMLAGWRGLFAVEKDKFAFATLRHNLIQGRCGFKYSWPRWFRKKRRGIKSFVECYQENLVKLRGKVTLIAGGPPCQGYSVAGKRKKDDYRNLLFRDYIKVVSLVQPAFLLLENVKGIDSEFGREGQPGNGRGRPAQPFSQRIANGLTRLGYRVFSATLSAAEFGVPQLRERYFIIAIHQSVLAKDQDMDPFRVVLAKRQDFLEAKHLPLKARVGVTQAISDLISIGKELIPCADMPRSQQSIYEGPRTHYQKLMHGSMNGAAPNSMRLPEHGERAVKKYRQILACKRGVRLSETDKKRLGIGRHRVIPLDPAEPSHTLTSVPDDLIHYCEPRILTVREYARLQSFPDWYEFKGNYTSGGDRRSKECPRYTQVANAVPPLLAELIGLALEDVRNQLHA